MMKKIRVFLGIVLVLILSYTGFIWFNRGEIKMSKKQVPIRSSLRPTETELALITVYDNNQYNPDLKTGLGFSCLAKFNDRDILFDTGVDSLTLLSNMERLNIDPQEIDFIVLSHIHGDHVDGLWGLLEKNKDVVTYIPVSFPDSFRERIKSYGASYQNIKGPTQIIEGVYSTGELGTSVKEQALAIETEKGLVILTGCAHPGVVEMARKAKEYIGQGVYLVLGGFHLGGMPEGKIMEIIADLKNLGVKEVAPCHCSGDRAREFFKESFGEDYLENGVGRIINL